MKFIAFIFLCTLSVKAFAQETSLAGFVFDADSKDRIARVNVLNLNTHASVYDNLNGVFSIEAKVGDRLVFSQSEHISDTITVESHVPKAIYMKRLSILLREVTIADTLQDPFKKLMEKKKYYSEAYGSLANKDFLNVGPQGAGLSIDAIYNSFSRAGRDATRLRATIQNDYHQDIIDYRFNKVFVSRITGLKDVKLADFMVKYRPGYYFVTDASDYEFISSIMANFKRYLRNPNARALTALYPSK
jgi:hypothetical protein